MLTFNTARTESERMMARYGERISSMLFSAGERMGFDGNLSQTATAKDCEWLWDSYQQVDGVPQLSLRLTWYKSCSSLRRQTSNVSAILEVSLTPPKDWTQFVLAVKLDTIIQLGHDIQQLTSWPMNIVIGQPFTLWMAEAISRQKGLAAHVFWQVASPPDEVVIFLARDTWEVWADKWRVWLDHQIIHQGAA